MVHEQSDVEALYHDEPELRSRIVGAYGAEGAAWLDRLPELITALATRWQIRELVQAEELSYSWIGFGSSVFGECCLKLSVPNHESLSEITALRAFGPTETIAQLYLTDPSGCAILEERIKPGSSLWSVEQPARDLIAAQTMAGLHAHSTGGDAIEHVPRVTDQADRAFAKAVRAGAPEALLSAIKLVTPFSSRAETEVRLIHGDLHHGNLLRSSTDPQWRVIDPKGVAAPLWMEPARYILNELWETEEDARKERWHNVIDTFADELHIDSASVARGSALDATLSVCWSFEEETRAKEHGVEQQSDMENRASLALAIAQWATAVEARVTRRPSP